MVIGVSNNNCYEENESMHAKSIVESEYQIESSSIFFILEYFFGKFMFHLGL